MKNEYKYKKILKEYEPSYFIDEEEKRYAEASFNLGETKAWVKENIKTPNVLYIERDFNISPPVAKIIVAFKFESDYLRFINHFNI